jgi:hypothetical protein
MRDSSSAGARRVAHAAHAVDDAATLRPNGPAAEPATLVCSRYRTMIMAAWADSALRFPARQPPILVVNEHVAHLAIV